MRFPFGCLKCGFVQMVLLGGIGLGLAGLQFNSGTTTTNNQRKMIADLLTMNNDSGQQNTGEPSSATPKATNTTNSQSPSTTTTDKQNTKPPSNNTTQPTTVNTGDNQTSPAVEGAGGNPNGSGSEDFQTYVAGIKGLMITLDQARHIYDAGLADPTGATEVYFVDAREENDFEKGHVPGAYHIPPEAFPNAKVLENVSYWSANAAVVVYCSGGNCDASNQVVLQLKNMGRDPFQHLFIMHDGFPGWQSKGWPVETGPSKH